MRKVLDREFRAGDKTLSTRISPELHEMFRQLCWWDRRAPSAVLRDLVAGWIDETADRATVTQALAVAKENTEDLR